MSNFIERSTDESMSMEVDMVLGDPPATAIEANRNYAAFQLSLECAKNEYLTDEDQRATYYLGGICCLLPDVTDDLQEALRSMDLRVRTISFPSAAARNGLIVPPKEVEPKKSMALFGYLLIMLYKNVDEVLFRGFFEDHLKKLFDISGFVPREGEDVSVFSDAEHAMYYRNSYGQNHGIRTGNSHVATFFFIFTILRGSPVLRAPRLADEIENFRRACEAVLATEFPCYYMIFEDPESYAILDRSNFPTLTAVAMKLRTNAELCEVDYYVAMHRNQLGDKSVSLSSDDNGNVKEDRVNCNSALVIN
ncbi:unnamed protein product [Microthlaspi erraticum]|uniref:Uncharacterized protein n=1 Tax=Microthlaspi erraticum TaxID=1685480 RepID=A0A6D2HH99_9BRAS|nr:unnamed protein product [Microthlaspi erraticum]